jgi:hypothetical protein
MRIVTGIVTVGIIISYCAFLFLKAVQSNERAQNENRPRIEVESSNRHLVAWAAIPAYAGASKRMRRSAQNLLYYGFLARALDPMVLGAGRSSHHCESRRRV